MKLYDAFSLPAAASGLFGEIFNFSCSRHFAFSLSLPLSLLFFFFSILNIVRIGETFSIEC